ncbi:TetR/AcrR family transcriptional regulator [Allonocardiopsis opalescens]|uniref:TetR family transcriptional regulator n=1 Tax=Allonocardiopsis opalescens TaxID=1144618 RepID=A0A2T0Q2A0_9ACTN|nr:TetR/AcrR family transcriptional regulator [Allonocardiopsis opalescens]PRX97926.1 TetR family transcriptional regulator [Allonocardiopsis opalescens]
MSAAESGAEPGAPVRRMPRAQRREQILDAATRAFARSGFADTSLDAIAVEAAVSRVVLYRHFDSKAALYRAVLDRACARLTERVGIDDFTDRSIPAMLDAASDDPDGFRLLFRYAAREPEFRELTDSLAADSAEITYRSLAALIGDEGWTRWATQVVLTLATEGVIAWLDAGRPDPDQAARRISAAIDGVIDAARRRLD